MTQTEQRPSTTDDLPTISAGRHRLESRPQGDRGLWAAHTRAAMQALSTLQCTVLELIYFERLSQVQIAARLGLPIARIQVSAASGLRMLGAIITD